MIGLLGPILADQPAAARRRLLGGPARPAAAIFSHGEKTTGLQAGADGFDVVRALFVLVRELADSRPLLILLDDVHWADRQSLQFLAYLQRRLSGLAVGLALAMRPPAAGVGPTSCSD